MDEVAEIHEVKKFHIEILYNGVEKKLKIELTEIVREILRRAIQIFNAQQPHLLALWTSDGQEITNLDQTAEQAGIHPDDKLILRPSQVRGG